jgi:hypothetical protein
LLQTLRLYVKYRLADKEDLKVINRKSREINKFIVQFSFTDVKLADKFTQKCFEYLSISAVAINQKEAEIAQAAKEAKLAVEREARRKLLDAQTGVGKLGKK